MRSFYLRAALLAAYLSFAAYCLLSLSLGPGGFFAYRSLSDNRDAMLANLESLRDSNTRLRSELASLHSDADRVEREARALGYLAPGETALILPGKGNASFSVQGEAGSVVRKANAFPLSDSAIKEISLVLGLACFVYLIARELSKAPASRTGRARNPSHQYFS